LKVLRTSWPARGWSWDKRLSCVTSSFSSENDDGARAAAAVAFPSEWTSTSIRGASAPVRDLAERTGGIRAGQLVLTSDAVGTAFGYCLWWPWGDGMTTSVRIGLGSLNPSADALQRLRDTFGVEV
jgi:hypothetical protein